MAVTVNVRMKQRRKVAADWTSTNEVLLEGEMGLETDTRKFKFGDGVTAWNSLAYAVPTVVSAFTNDAGYLTSVNNGNWSGTDLDISNGGTGASSAGAARTNLGLAIGTDVQAQSSVLAFLATASAATAAAVKTLLALVKADVGLGSVDNTADTAKPVSTAQQTALDLKANLASPAFTGTPTIGNAGGAGINYSKTGGTAKQYNVGVDGDAAFTIFDATAGLTRFYQTSTGNLGIGDFYAGSLPGAKLHVEGSFRANNEGRVGSLRVDETATAAAVTQTHHIPISINGTTYKLLLAS